GSRRRAKGDRPSPGHYAWPPRSTQPCLRPPRQLASQGRLTATARRRGPLAWRQSPATSRSRRRPARCLSKWSNPSVQPESWLSCSSPFSRLDRVPLELFHEKFRHAKWLAIPSVRNYHPAFPNTEHLPCPAW